MPDMLVRLYKLPSLEQALARCRDSTVTIRRAQPYELTAVRAFVKKHFSMGWADEATAGFSRTPVSVWIAVRETRIIGFGCYECTRRDYFGPTGVVEEERGKNIGYALLVACLHGLADLGYAYGIIGGAGPVEFYTKAVGAELIADSVPGIYTPAATDY